jgi:hypothetical protein
MRGITEWHRWRIMKSAANSSKHDTLKASVLLLPSHSKWPQEASFSIKHLGNQSQTPGLWWPCWLRNPSQPGYDCSRQNLATGPKRHSTGKCSLQAGNKSSSPQESTEGHLVNHLNQRVVLLNQQLRFNLIVCLWILDKSLRINTIPASSIVSFWVKQVEMNMKNDGKTPCGDPPGHVIPGWPWSVRVPLGRHMRISPVQVMVAARGESNCPSPKP